MTDQPPTAPLPEQTPRRIKAFVSCRIDAVLINENELGFISGDSLGGFATPITVSPPATGNAPGGVVHYGNGDFPVSVGDDGGLVVDTSAVDGVPVLGGLGDQVQDWVKAFNATLTANDKGMEIITVQDGVVTLVKAPIGTPPADSTTPTDEGTLVTPSGSSDAGTTAPTPPATPAPTPTPGPGLWQRFTDWLGSFFSLLTGSPLGMLAGLLVLVLIGVVTLFALSGGDDTVLVDPTPDRTGDGEVANNDDNDSDDVEIPTSGSIAPAVPEHLRGANPTDSSNLGENVVEVSFSGDAKTVLQNATLADARVQVHLQSGTVRITLSYQTASGTESSRSLLTDMADAEPTEDGSGSTIQSTTGDLTAEWVDESTLRLTEGDIEIPADASVEVQVLIQETPDEDFHSMVHR